MNTSTQSASFALNAIETLITGGEGSDREPGSANSEQGLAELLVLLEGVTRLLTHHGCRLGQNPKNTSAIIKIGALAAGHPGIAKVILNLTTTGNATECRIAAIRCLNNVALVPSSVLQALQGLLHDPTPGVVFAAGQTWLEVTSVGRSQRSFETQSVQIEPTEVAQLVLAALANTDGSGEIRAVVAGLLFELLVPNEIKIASPQPIVGASSATVVMLPVGTTLPQDLRGNAMARDGRIFQVDDGVALVGEVSRA